MAQDVVDVIMADHREVERLFAELKAPEKRAGLVPVLTTLLTAHSRAEEAQVYPVARDEAGIAEDIAHSQAEHVEAEQLLAVLAETDPATPEFDEVLAQVVHAVTHHVEEEETTVLPGMRAALSEQRLTELADAFLTARSDHLGEQPEDVRKRELEQQAANMGLSGSSARSKAELQQQLRRQAASEE